MVSAPEPYSAFSLADKLSVRKNSNSTSEPTSPIPAGESKLLVEGQDRAVDQHDLGGGRRVVLVDQAPTQHQQGGHQDRVEVPRGSQTPDQERTTVEVGVGLLDRGQPVLLGLDPRPAVDRPQGSALSAVN
jgi:hypothetical protein